MKKWLIGCCAGMAGLVLLGELLLGWIKTYEDAFFLSFVPDALQVSSVAYQLEESWGFGPGGNEAGIRLYPLPAKVAEQIAAGGVSFLNTMPPNQQQDERRWRGYYSDWQETPIRSSEHWQPKPATGRLDIYDYVCAYGFCIDIEPEVVKQVDAILNRPGSYYAYGRIGVLIVCPAEQVVIYAFNG